MMLQTTSLDGTRIFQNKILLVEYKLNVTSYIQTVVSQAFSSRINKC